MMEKREHGLTIPRGVSCLLTYFLPFIGGFFFLLVEKKDKLVRFHSVQSIFFWIFFSIYGVMVNAIVWIAAVRTLLQLAFVAVWVFVMYQALCERLYELPIMGDIARHLVYGRSGRDNGGD